MDADAYFAIAEDIENERAGPHRHRDVDKDRMQRMPQPRALQEIEQPFRAAERRAFH